MPATATTHTAVVIGAGYAGLAAARALARQGVRTALIDDGYLGGLLLNVGVLEGPPEANGQSGADLVNLLLGEALEAGADYKMGAVADLRREGDAWSLPDHGVVSPHVLLATGAKLRELGVPGEAALTGRGVSQCAFCDGGLYRGKPVAVVGGGDAAFQEALHLTEMCGSVVMLLRGAAPRARTAFVARAAARGNLEIRYSVQVREIVGADGVDAVRIRDGATGAEETLAVDAVFPFVGLTPETALAPADAARDSAGALIVDAAMRTSTPGLSAIAAARSGYGGQAADALADAEAAAAAIGGGSTR